MMLAICGSSRQWKHCKINESVLTESNKSPMVGCIRKLGRSLWHTWLRKPCVVFVMQTPYGSGNKNTKVRGRAGSWAKKAESTIAKANLANES